MDTQKITHEIRMKHWMQIIAQRQQSGLTVKEFCAQQDIPIKQYYYWQHKLRIRFAPAQAPETKKEEVIPYRVRFTGRNHSKRNSYDDCTNNTGSREQ